MALKVTLERGAAGQKARLENLAQLYVHDFTDFLGPTRRIDVLDDGRFPDLMGLDRYWSEADRSVWFIRAEGMLAGFALVNTQTHSGMKADFNMAEFFVIRPYRGRDVAGQAVEQLLARLPGQWEVSILQDNAPALRFWPRAVGRARICALETSLQGDPPKRTILRFLAG